MNDFQNKINNHLQNTLLIYFKNFVLLIYLKIDDEIHLYMMLIMNLLILFCV